EREQTKRDPKDFAKPAHDREGYADPFGIPERYKQDQSTGLLPAEAGGNEGCSSLHKDRERGERKGGHQVDRLTQKIQDQIDFYGFNRPSQEEKQKGIGKSCFVLSIESADRFIERQEFGLSRLEPFNPKADPLKQSEQSDEETAPLESQEEAGAESQYGETDEGGHNDIAGSVEKSQPESDAHQYKKYFRQGHDGLRRHHGGETIHQRDTVAAEQVRLHRLSAEVCGRSREIDGFAGHPDQKQTVKSDFLCVTAQ